MRFSRRLVLLLSFLFIVSIVSAAEILQNTVCTVESEEVIEGNLFVLCRDLTIDGEVHGHLLGTAINARITGRVDKNVYLASGDLFISGEINGDIHYLGGVLELQNEARIASSDVISLALSSRLAQDTAIDSIVGFGYQLLLDGDIESDVDYWGGALRIGGNVGGNVTASIGDAQSVGSATQLESFLIPFPFSADLVDMGLYIPETAEIAGNLDYVGYVASDVTGDVFGDVTFTRIETGPTLQELTEQETRLGALERYIQQVIREVITLGFIGVLLLFALPETLQSPISVLRRRTVSSLGVGILTFMISFPLFLLTVFLSIFLIFILSLVQIDAVLFASGILIGLVDIGGASIFYFIAIYISRIVTGVAIGRFLLFRFDTLERSLSWYYSLFIGVVIISMLSSLPVIGWVVNAIALFVGFGSLVLVFQAQIRRFRDDMRRSYPSSSSVSFVNAEGNTVPPPVLDDVHKRPRGMDNLPEGFTWWTDDNE